jgi:16S rRNA (guanine(966)-N(2))-methyltransferase RsmD
MRTQLRIVAGSLKGRKLTCNVSEALRPTPQMVREALFSILGNAVPGRPFYDVFAGTGIFGIEAISRGASHAVFLERDFRQIGELEDHHEQFGIRDRARIVRGDVYRWAERWQPPKEAVNVFLSPPFADLDNRPEEMLALVATLRERLPAGSVIALQVEQSKFLEQLPQRSLWDERKYGRNYLLFWVQGETGTEAPSTLEPAPEGQETDDDEHEHESDGT